MPAAHLLLCTLLAAAQLHAVLGASLPEIEDNTGLGSRDETDSSSSSSSSKQSHPTEDQRISDESIRITRGIMEDFTKDFMSPADDEALDGDFFNEEPFYYDAYYDSYPVDEDLDAPPPGALQSRPPPPDYPDDASSIRDALDLTLLGGSSGGLGEVLQQLTNSSQRNRRHNLVRHHDPSHHTGGINVSPASKGSCPPPVHSLPPGLCGATPCTSHMACYPSRMCCFNGCTYTCTEPVKPPPVIDWVEETGERMPMSDPSNPALPLRFESSPLSYGTGGGETIRLPGGCSLSSQKYSELKEFMTAQSIQDCICSGGEVVCMVKSSP